LIVESSSQGRVPHDDLYEDLARAQETCDSWQSAADDTGMPLRYEVYELRPVTYRADGRLVVKVNTNVTMSRGKAAAQAVHAALELVGRHHGGPVIVLGGKPAEIEAMPVTIHDAGQTELQPGTLTAGAEWHSDGPPW
jgi:PTH2 family peptidyl-tRNA hydrolase